MAKINALDKEVKLYTVNDKDYISLTDIARYKDSKRSDYIIQNWLRNRNTIEFPRIWKNLNNPDFNPIEFDGIAIHQRTLLAGDRRLKLQGDEA